MLTDHPAQASAHWLVCVRSSSNRLCGCWKYRWMCHKAALTLFVCRWRSCCCFLSVCSHEQTFSPQWWNTPDQIAASKGLRFLSFLENKEKVQEPCTSGRHRGFPSFYDFKMAEAFGGRRNKCNIVDGGIRELDLGGLSPRHSENVACMCVPFLIRCCRASFPTSKQSAEWKMKPNRVQRRSAISARWKPLRVVLWSVRLLFAPLCMTSFHLW